MSDEIKIPCRCGRKVEKLYSYKDSITGYRITVCENCGNENGFESEERWIKMPYKEITEDFKKTPEPDAKGN
jgi:hypothetical protein